MDSRTWNEIDVIAEQEAEALRKARAYRSFNYRHTSLKGVINRDQAMFDEGLTIHFTTCAFCGCTFNPQEEEEDPALRKTHYGGGRSVSLFTKDCDVCNSCSYLHGRLIRSAPARQTVG